ncbi:cupin domain-containing protein [Actinokineospora sp. G85]|uniref:cupin domain-containing protein n=1 Tax=Actinokineospora sp. G85 TaxID=3406626 RepID=UPI003C7202CE
MRTEHEPADAITVTPLAAPGGPSRTKVDHVRFAPGARTRWRSHPLGRVLVVTEGTGWAQRRGGPIELVEPGDTVRVEPGEWHWHGATDTTATTHLTIEEIPADGARAEVGDPATPVTRTVVMTQSLPTPRLVAHVETRRITMAPCQGAGVHTHNGPVFGSIESGSAVYQVDGGQAAVLRPGDVFYEPEGTRITRFDAQGQGVTFLAHFPVGPGEIPILTPLGS